MNEQECLSRMVAPGTPRPGKWRGSVIQILVTSSCNLSCSHCTQASNLKRKPWFMTPEQFERAVLSLKGYQGVYGTFGGCPTISPHFHDYCRILQKHVPKDQCGLWANNLMGKGAICRETYDPSISNLNVHLDQEAYNEIIRDWPEARPFGIHKDSRHGPVFVAMKDVIPDEGQRWELISACDVNHFWSAAIGVFRGELRAWFCEIACSQSLLHQDESDYPDTGIPIINLRGNIGHVYYGQLLRDTDPTIPWWQLPMHAFAGQVRKHCHECSVPLRGFGQLAMATEGAEQTSATHAAVFKPKRKGRPVEVVTDLVQIGIGRVQTATKYLQNAAL